MQAYQPKLFTMLKDWKAFRETSLPDVLDRLKLTEIACDRQDQFVSSADLGQATHEIQQQIEELQEFKRGYPAEEVNKIPQLQVNFSDLRKKIKQVELDLSSCPTAGTMSSIENRFRHYATKEQLLELVESTSDSVRQKELTIVQDDIVKIEQKIAARVMQLDFEARVGLIYRDMKEADELRARTASVKEWLEALRVQGETDREKQLAVNAELWEADDDGRASRARLAKQL